MQYVVGGTKNNNATNEMVVVNSAKEKEIKKLEKTIKQIESLENELEAGKKLDAAQLKKIEKKGEAEMELARLLQKIYGE